MICRTRRTVARCDSLLRVIVDFASILIYLLAQLAGGGVVERGVDRFSRLTAGLGDVSTLWIRHRLRCATALTRGPTDYS